MPSSLCFPDEEKSCFACCPPIRPPGYAHVHYKNIVKRILRENTNNFDGKEKSITPITGFSCWALGYIGNNHKLVGCMLHPARNKGIDLRYRVKYGDKCRRESCQEEKIFSSLGNNEQAFWLHLADGLDSFAYSSREYNPLFKMMGWGAYLLKTLAEGESKKVFTRDSFFSSYPIFTTKLKPGGNAYLLNRLVKRLGLGILLKDSLKGDFEHFSAVISEQLKNKYAYKPDGDFTHLLDLDPDFSSFLRISAGISRIKMETAISAKEIVDNELERLIKKISR
jgi:hypothetical protein